MYFLQGDIGAAGMDGSTGEKGFIGQPGEKVGYLDNVTDIFSMRNV